MGNTLSAAVPSLILPVEAYISDIGEFTFVHSLGSTRFMKVGRVLHSGGEGPAVLKVFVHQDPSFSLDPYREQVVAIRDSLKDAPNCCPFRNIIMTDKCAVLSRQFGYKTLYDRLSTRPFLAEIEKRWIAYQLLKALDQCHTAGVCHGDIKSQNILVSSWAWVQLCDFASFKPAFLPYDNPSDFSFFFDTSRKRSCYVAPERFLSTAEVQQNAGGVHVIALPQDFCNSSNTLTQAMDIFSLACVLIELFSDGQVPFTFSQLLAYRESTKEEKSHLLERCLCLLPPGNEGLKDMIASMLDRDPTRRPTASHLLHRYRAKVFPDIFYSFVFPYLNAIMVAKPLLPYDDRLLKLISDERELFRNLSGPSGHFCQSGLIFLSVLTSLVRSLHYASSRQQAIKYLYRMSMAYSDSVISERILPYLVYMLNDNYPRVRRDAIHFLTKMLNNLKDIPKEANRLFIDYIFLRLARTANDSCSLVRITLATNMGDLAETSLRFLKECSSNLLDDTVQMTQQGEKALSDTRLRIMRDELRSLQTAVQDIIVSLLCDSDNSVRRAVVGEEGLRKLCRFLGKENGG